MITFERPEDTVTVIEAAKTIELNPETIRRAIREGKLPALKIGNTFFIHKNDLDRYEQVNKSAFSPVKEVNSMSP